MNRFVHGGCMVAVLCGAMWPAAVDAAAVDRCGPSPSDCAVIGEWQLSIGAGIGIHTNPLVGGDDIPIVLLPRWSYYGERFYMENLELGYTVLENANHSLHLVLTPGLDHIYFEDWGIGNLGLDSSASGPVSQDSSADFADSGQPDTTEGDRAAGDVSVDNLKDRRIAFLAGAGYGLFLNQWSLHAQLLRDVNRVHRGEAFRLGVTRSFGADGQALNLSGGFVWQSADLLDYYYGVDADEVDTQANVYSAGSGVTPFVKVNWQSKLSQKWTWETVVNYRRLNEEITDSPVVREDEVFVFFTAARYRF